MNATATRTEQGTVTVITGPTSDREQRPARRNTRPDGTQVVIYVSTSRRVAPSVAATFVPDAACPACGDAAGHGPSDCPMGIHPVPEVAQPSQLDPAELEQHLAQEDELAAEDATASPTEQAEAIIVAEAARLATPSRHRLQWFDAPDGTQVPRKSGGQRRMSDPVAVECSCGWTSGADTRKVIDRLVREHKHGA